MGTGTVKTGLAIARPFFQLTCLTQCYLYFSSVCSGSQTELQLLSYASVVDVQKSTGWKYVYRIVTTYLFGDEV